MTLLTELARPLDAKGRADAEDAATDAKRTIESRIPSEGIEFFFGRPFGLVGATVHPPCMTCC